MDNELIQSYSWCEKVTRNKAKNFYYGLRLLPKPRRLAAYAFYAFCRDCDDISDDEGSSNRNLRLAEWHRRLSDDGGNSTWPGLLAFRHAMETYSIPKRFLHELVDGTTMDLTPRSYADFQDTYTYCYHVASTVGLVCVHLFGFDPKDQAEVYRLAETQGQAFQLTNIMRDVSEDVSLQRRYLPDCLLERCHVTPAELASQKNNAGTRQLYAKMLELTESYYRLCAPLPRFIEPESRACLRALTVIYHGVARKLAKLGPEALKKRARLNKAEKLLWMSYALLLGGAELAWYKTKKWLTSRR